MFYVGIDPGKDGAVAVLSDLFVGGFRVFDTPTVGAGKGQRKYDVSGMVKILREIGDPDLMRVTFEQVNAMPGQGVTSMFSMGQGFGLWEGILAALQIPYTLIRPQLWKKVMIPGLAVSAGTKAERSKALKAAAVLQAQRLWPRSASFFTGPKGGLLDGRAESALLAEYGRRVVFNPQGAQT